MGWLKRVMERGQPPVAAPYATTPNGAPFPLRSWPPDAAIDIQNLATWVDPMKPETVRRFVDAAARTATIPSPAEGMVTTLNSTNSLDRYTGSVWRRVTPVALHMGAGGPSDANGLIAVTFPVGLFNAAPMVTATVTTTTQSVSLVLETISATGFSARVRYFTGGTFVTTTGFQLQYIAMQAT